MSAFATYLIGFFALIIGLAIAAYLLNVPPLWIAMGAFIIIGIGIFAAARRTRPRDPPTV